MTRLLLASALFLSLAACGGSDSGTKTTTKLDAVEVQPGTISDSMITLDDTDIDGTAVDNRVPDDAKTPKKEDEAAGDEAAETNEEEADPDAVPAPAARKDMPSNTEERRVGKECVSTCRSRECPKP